MDDIKISSSIKGYSNMNITIENFKNLKQLNYTIDDNKINFLFGMSGFGKSSILSALADDVPNNNRKFGLSSSDIDICFL